MSSGNFLFWTWVICSCLVNEWGDHFFLSDLYLFKSHFLFILAKSPANKKKMINFVSYFYNLFCHKIVFTYFVQEEVVVLYDRSIL